MRRTRIIIRLIVVVAVLGAIVMAFLLPKAGSPPGIGFLGYTNAPAGSTNALGTGERMAMFGFTNQSRATIRRWCGVNPEFKVPPGLPWLFTIKAGSDAILRPGQSEVVLVPMDTNMIFTNQGAWRAVFFWRNEGGGARFADWANTSNFVPPMFQTAGRGMRVKPRVSDWIEQ